MTVAEHLRFFGRLKRVDAARIAEVGEKLRLTEFARRTPKECSKGQRQRLGLAQALLTEPELLLLDEPTTGLDPQTTEALYAELVQMKEKGCAVLICTHELALAENFLDCVLMIKEGRIAAQAETLDALRAKANLPVRVTLTPAAVQKRARDCRPGASRERRLMSLRAKCRPCSRFSRKPAASGTLRCGIRI